MKRSNLHQHTRQYSFQVQLEISPCLVLVIHHQIFEESRENRYFLGFLKLTATAIAQTRLLAVHSPATVTLVVQRLLCF